MRRRARNGAWKGESATISTRRPWSAGGRSRSAATTSSGRNDREDAASARPCPGLDPPPHAGHEATGDGEAEPRALVAPAGAVVALLELLEQAGQPLRRDARSGVADDEVQTGALAAQVPRRRRCARELDGVSREIDQDLANPFGIADHQARHVVGDIEGDLDALVLRARSQEFHHRLGDRARIEGFGGEIQAPASMREKSRMPSIRLRSALPEVFTAST